MITALTQSAYFFKSILMEVKGSSLSIAVPGVKTGNTNVQPTASNLQTQLPKPLEKKVSNNNNGLLSVLKKVNIYLISGEEQTIRWRSKLLDTTVATNEVLNALEVS